MSCESKRWPLCGRRTGPVPSCPAPEPVHEIGVADGVEYTILTNEHLNWHDAEVACQEQFGGHLASILNDAEHEVVNALVEADGIHRYWIGYHEEGGEEGEWKWSDDSETSWPHYTNWLPNEPNQWAGLEEDCTEIGLWGSFQWNDIECSTLFKPICSRRSAPLIVVDEPALPPLPVEYVILKDMERTWHQAEEACQIEFGGHLASILNDVEQNAVNALVNDDGMSRYWIGLNEHDQEDVWRWTDESCVTHLNWLPGEPNDWSDLPEDCTEVGWGGKHGWNDSTCDVKKWAICSRRNEPVNKCPVEEPWVGTINTPVAPTEWEE